MEYFEPIFKVSMVTKVAIGDLTLALRRSEGEEFKADNLKVGYRSGIGRVWIQGWVVHRDPQDNNFAYVDDGTGILKLQAVQGHKGFMQGSMVLAVGKPQMVDKHACLTVHQLFELEDPDRESLWMAEVVNDTFTDDTSKSL